jgi:hypothetical protein
VRAPPASGRGSEIFVARVAPDGTVLDPYGIRLGQGSFPAVAFDGASFLVVASLDLR